MYTVASARKQLLRCASFIPSISSRLGRSGAVAIITAVSAPFLIMIVGFATDYGYASYINQALARATDSATVGSVSQTAATTAGGYTNLTTLQNIGTNYFNANIAKLSVNNVSFSLLVVSDGSGGVIATGSYSYNVPTFFSGLVGYNTFPLSGSATTTARPLIYVNYYILVDTSQSMGIASTQADMNALYSRVAANNNATTSDSGCVFGCHVKGYRPNGTLQPYTNEDLAHNITKNFGARINLRIDSAVSAIQSIINTAGSVAATTKNIQFALYEIQLDPSNNNLITSVATMSSNYSSLASAAGTIELGNNNAGGSGDSDFKDELSAFNKMLTQNGVTSNGSGASATSPLNFVFIITDGASDIPGSCGYGHCMSAFDANNCAAIKSKATVGTIYTTYAPIYKANDASSGQLDQSFVDLVKPFTMPVDQIAQALQSCATSTDYAFQANDGPDIVAAMQSLFARTQPVSARITQ